MNRAAIFFDRDNTLIANDGYLGNPDGVVLISGAANAIARLRAEGFAIVTFSNQSGVARGMFPEEAVHAVNARMDEMLRDEDSAAIIDRHEFCPFHPEATVERYKQDSELRKPKPGMIYQAADRLKLDRHRSWVIGDAPRDIAAGHAAGCRTILFKNSTGTPSPAALETMEVEPDFTAGTLLEAVDIIERNSTREPEAETSAACSNESREHDQTAVAREQPASAGAPATGAAPKRMTFAERVRAGTYQPAREAVAPGVIVNERLKRAETDRPKLENPPAAAPSRAAEAPPAVRPTEPVSQNEQLEPLLRQMLEELRVLRHQSHRGAEFSLSKLLAGVVQVLVLPVLFFAYLHRESPGDFQSVMMLATYLQTLTIALLVMGRQS